MAREYYDTRQKVYSLFKTHPVMASFISEFEVDEDALKALCDLLLANDAAIQSVPLSGYYTDSAILDQAAHLLGFDADPWNAVAPWATKGPSGSSIAEFLNFTLYLYKFGVADNFYEKHILDFIPEYDREQVQASEKLTLTVQSLGRHLDQMEDKISRIKDLYDIDKAPDEALDYLGQNIGYEREDFTLSNVSFRELLKNIIEIYKIKGTNYSFSFFFKFLGFEIDLKEFFFNRDVNNPEAFPGMDANNVEYFLATTNPLYETGNTFLPDSGATIPLKPAPNLGQTRNLNDWEVERQSLIAHGCTNATLYMRGLATFSNDGLTWHSNPWKHFKTNLIEYTLNPFLDKLSLTASDNETIKKYVKFLSPTYLFTWININLRPWIEDVNIVVDQDEEWVIELNKTLGDPRPITGAPPVGFPPLYGRDPHFAPPFFDYEDLFARTGLFKTKEQLLQQAGTPLYGTGESLAITIANNMNRGGDDLLGTILRRDGTHVRQPGNPQHIADARHRGDRKIAFDFLGISLKRTSAQGYKDYSNKPFPAMPVNPSPFNGRNILTTNTVDFTWERIEGETGYRIQVATDSAFSSLVHDETLSTNSFTPAEPMHNNAYFWRVRVRNELDWLAEELDRWGPWSVVWKLNLESRPFPFDGEVIDSATVFVTPTYTWRPDGTSALFASAAASLAWPSEPRVGTWDIELNDGNVTSSTSTVSSPLPATLSNRVYSWRHRANYLDGRAADWSAWTTFTVSFPATVYA